MSSSYHSTPGSRSAPLGAVEVRGAVEDRGAVEERGAADRGAVEEGTGDGIGSGGTPAPLRLFFLLPTAGASLPEHNTLTD